MSRPSNHRRPQPRQRVGRARPRRGIILLFVMALLALFALVTVTFVIVAHAHKVSAGRATVVERNFDTSKALLDRAAQQILVGSGDPFSSLGPHSLLEDMYGNDGLLGTVMPTTIPSLPGTPFAQYGQVLRFKVVFDSGSPYLVGALSGRVLTITSGQLKGHSWRILNYDPRPNYQLVSVLVEDVDAAVAATQLSQGDRVLVNGRAFNGTGFGLDIGPNMAGVLTRAANPLSGAQPSDGTFPFLGALDPVSTGEYALLPNAKFFTPNTTMGPLGPLYLDVAGPGGADEDVDVPDMQDMLLAFERVPVNGVDAPVAIPSLHRPELIHYWMQKIAALGGSITYPPASPSPTGPTFVQLWNQGGAAGIAAQRILRRAMLRPVGGFPGADHPDFTGSNPSPLGFDPVLGGRGLDTNSDGTPDLLFSWDVDNDGDGVPDSIWVDIGLPPRAGPDGRMVKPLVAVLCLDQDGKLNLNAHGTLGQANELIRDYNVLAPSASNPAQLATALLNWPLPLPNGSTNPQFGYMFPPAGTNGSQTVILPEGFGYGPAEINLRALFVTNPAEYLRLLQGWPTNGNDWPSAGSLNPPVRIDGRYGEGQRFAAGTSPPLFPIPGGLPGAAPDLRLCWQGRWRQFDLPNSYWDIRPLKTPPIVPNPATEFTIPPDLNGDGSVAYDTHGQPIYRNASEGDLSSGIYEKTASQYDIDLSRRAQRGRAINASQTGGVDSPFTPAEWERLLRYGDIDSASMPRRLIDLATSAFETGVPTGQSPTQASLIQAAINRKLVTTESWDVNVPSMLPTMELGGDMVATGLIPFNMQLTDLVFSRLKMNGFITSMSATELVKANTALQKLLPWDLLAGVKLDINRPFGNGRDDTAPNQPGFGVVDEPMAYAGGQITSEVIGPDRSGRPGEWLWEDPANPLPIVVATGARMDHNNDGVHQPTTISGPPAAMFNADGNDLLARQLFARHLYIMMCSLFDQKLIAMIIKIQNDQESNPAERWVALDVYRRFAQWAVNVVDSRDSDAIMTPFEFDATPFFDDTGSGVTWNVDDNPGTVEGPATGPTFRAVVWGCERPELLITESIAWHDRRTADTKSDTQKMNSVHQPLTGRPPDNDYDQVRRPQGAVFFELYVPWNPPVKNQSSPQATVWGTGSMPPAEFYHYDPATDRYSFQLDRAAPNGDPVWRMAVVNADRDVDECPDNPRSPITPNPDKIDRVIYFTTNSSRVSAISPATEEPFLRQGGPAQILVPPGGYAVIGGDASTVMRGQSGAAGSTFDLNVGANPQTTSGVSIDGNGPQIHGNLGRPLGPIGVVIDQTLAGQRRLSLSEPYKGSAADNYTTEDDAATVNDGTPWDASNTILQAQPSTMNGTALKKFTVFLQRLANPLLPWNPESGRTGYNTNLPINPYLTVDMMYVDLTVYNSETPQTTGDEPGIPPTPTPAFKFETRERGFVEQQRPNIWSSNFSATSGQEPGAGDPIRLTSGKQTLGYLNRVFGAPLANGNPYDSALGAGQTVYRGDPQLTTLQGPFPAFPWLNRPFINPYELMMIPVAHPFELLFGFVVRDPSISAANLADPIKNPYTIPYQNLPNGDPFRVMPYGMLGPMYMSMPIPPAVVPPGISPPAYSLPNFFRLMDFVQVPSRFSGTETILNPAPVNTAFGVSPPALPETLPRGLYPPFNRVPRFREPGKVNINTIAHGNVWLGLTNGTTDTPVVGGPAPALQQTTIQWMKLMLSRRGSNPANLASFIAAPDPVPNLLVDPPRDRTGGLLPTYFATPFRSYAGSYMVPTANMRMFNLGVMSAIPLQLPRSEVDATLLRVDPLTGMTPLFSNAVQLNSSGTPTPVTGPAYADPVGNPATFYKSLHKIGGLVTNRSNVYAVWVTLGFFECEQVAVDEGHPDGYRLGREAAVDTGEVRRHRAFFIVDRSIPVGFQRGEAHNAENAILLKRFIE